MQRAFDLDAKGVRVYDADGADAAARVGAGKTLNPGEAHLRISQDVFLQTACARQHAVGLESGSAGDVSTALAQALGGGPKEDAALGALARLDAALRSYVGTDRAYKNAPLKKLRELEGAQRRAGDDARHTLAALAALRERIVTERAQRDRDAAAAAELERRSHSLRAAHIRARLGALKDYRDEVAALQSARAAFDDVRDFAPERIAAFEDAYHSWRSACSVAEAAARAAAEEVAGAGEGRIEAEGARLPAGTLVVAALTAMLADVGVAVAHQWTWTVVASAVALILAIAAFRRGRTESALVALSARDAAVRKAAARAHAARAAADTEGAHFDELARGLVDAGGGRGERRAAVQARAARRRERDGLDARLAMLAIVRSDILQGDDEFALQAEYDALLARGVEPAAEDAPQTWRALERQRAQLDLRAREAERLVADLEGELRAGEKDLRDVAALDEELALTRGEIARLEGFARAAELARATIEARKDEAHRAFARRLEEYGAAILHTLTAGRYGEIRLDPATLAIRVRVPETGAIEELDKLSAGTRDQIALVVRFATARMFAEGLETPPLLLDDPFAFWDAERIARCLPILLHGALDAQCILFTASAELAAAAAAAGAHRIDLGRLTALA